MYYIASPHRHAFVCAHLSSVSLSLSLSPPFSRLLFIFLPLYLQPLSSSHHTDSFATINATNHINHNNNHNKSSPSLDSCIEFSKKSSSKGPSSLGSACDSIGFDSMSYQTKSRGSLSTRSSSSGDLGPPEYDLGPHRELPVDVPDNFVEMAKAPPRYPPPKLHMVKEIVKSKESLSSNGSIEKELIQSQLSSPKASNRNNEVYFYFFYFFFFCNFISFVFILNFLLSISILLKLLFILFIFLRINFGTNLNVYRVHQCIAYRF